MQLQLEQVGSRYGAPMGRPDWQLGELETDQRLTLQRVRLNSGGYDAGGAYWGIGKPLFLVCDESGHSHYFRAADRAAARATIRAAKPDARLYR
jgi:hypothetical protein